jgi:hypothetical protein
MTASSKSRVRGRSYTPILFVIVTLALWYFFQLLMRIVITCLPGGDACLLGLWPNVPRFLYGSAPLDVIVSLLTLALALWPSIRIFFPPEDLSAPPPPTRDRAVSNK